ncbi:response regulator [Candidatus Aerophobetes bacterium]|nr:response regulator [Candidatus Aerophobetes bacterium]
MKKKILLVDDDKDFLEGTRVFLEKNDFEVATAISGKECLERLNSFRPNLLILDIMMPEKSGFEVCREIKSSLKYNKIPVIMLTALKQKLSQTSYSVSQGLELEAEDYIDKPVKPDELISRIKNLLQGE